MESQAYSYDGMNHFPDRLTAITTLALKTGKPKKDEAHRLFRELVEQGDLSDDEMARLYKFFMPAPRKSDQSDFAWVNRAVNPNESRESIRAVYTDRDPNSGRLNILGTDGFRLHAVPVDEADYDEGIHYDAQGNPAQLNGPFPDLWRVIPEQSKEDYSAILDVENHGYHIKPGPGSFQLVCINGRWFRWDWILTAMGEHQKARIATSGTVLKIEPNTMIKSRLALIMARND